MTQAAYKAATGLNQPNLLHIVTDNHDEATRSAVAQATERHLTDAGIVVRSSESVSRSAAAGAGHMLPLILVFLGLSIGISVVGFARLTSTMSSSVLERTREFGVMSAIGASATIVRRISYLIATLAAPLVTMMMVEYLPMAGLFQVSMLGAVIWAMVVVLGAALATLTPASRASRMTVREALAYL